MQNRLIRDRRNLMSIYDTLNERQKEAVFYRRTAADPRRSRVRKDDSTDTQDRISDRGEGRQSVEYTWRSRSPTRRHGEMRERVDALVAGIRLGGGSAWVSTFPLYLRAHL